MIHGETKSNEEFMIFPTHRIPTSKADDLSETDKLRLDKEKKSGLK